MHAVYQFFVFIHVFCLGTTELDVDDWQRNTKYAGYSVYDEVIVWFWELVRTLSREEKALLLKFATGKEKTFVSCP